MKQEQNEKEEKGNLNIFENPHWSRIHRKTQTHTVYYGFNSYNTIHNIKVIIIKKYIDI